MTCPRAFMGESKLWRATVEASSKLLSSHNRSWPSQTANPSRAEALTQWRWRWHRHWHGLARQTIVRTDILLSIECCPIRQRELATARKIASCKFIATRLPRLSGCLYVLGSALWQCDLGPKAGGVEGYTYPCPSVNLISFFEGGNLVEEGV
jgi:hypothetical protein